jgi:predicted RNase H-like HicB family nuclease
MTRLEDYTIVTRPDDNGTFVAYVPAIPGCHAWGRTSDEARTELVHVFDMIKDEYDNTACGAETPAPTPRFFARYNRSE